MKKKENESKVMNPFVDWGFKYLFGVERAKKNLMGFLNLLLELETPIIELRYLNNESIPLDDEGRECVFDILCEDEKGKKFLVEVQNAAIGYIRNRMVYYTCRLIDQMGEQGKEWQYDIKKVYSICLMNFTYEMQPVLRRDFLLCEPSTDNILSDKLHFIMLQLPCLEKTDIQECENFYEKLLYLLIQMKEGMKTIEELKQEVYKHGLNDHIREVFLGVLEDADVASLSPKERAIYDARLKRYRDNRACLDYAIEDGVRQGLEKGKTEGRAEGRAEGRVEGQQEEKLRIAKELKECGVAPEIIAKTTNLTLEQIEQI